MFRAEPAKVNESIAHVVRSSASGQNRSRRENDYCSAHSCFFPFVAVGDQGDGVG